MENKSDWKITSIGTVCANKWSVCLKSGFEYLSSPMDNVGNMTTNQMMILQKLVDCSFSIISRDRPELLKRVYRYGKSVVDGRQKNYYGYDYIGHDLPAILQMTHFFDDGNGNEYGFDESWARWDHKVKKFMEALQDKEQKIIISNLRVFDELPEETRQILDQTLEFRDMLVEKYDRGPENMIIVNEIVSFRNDCVVEYEDPTVVQIDIPSGDELNINYIYRDYKKPVYLEQLHSALKRHGIE